MFAHQTYTTPSSIIVDSHETFVEYMDMDPYHPFINDSSLDVNEYLEIVENIFNEKQDVSYPSITNDQIGSSDISGTSSFDYSEPSPSNTVSHLSDNNDADRFDPTEWLMQDPSTKKTRPPRLIEFLRLLLSKSHYSSYASWLNKDEGLFKIHQPNQVAALWKKIKRRKTIGDMDYDKLARGIRYYYNHGIMTATYTRHTYRFASNNK